LLNCCPQIARETAFSRSGSRLLLVRYVTSPPPRSDRARWAKTRASRATSADQGCDNADIPWLHSLTRSGDAPSEPRRQPPDGADAIVVLAGGQTTAGSGLPPWVERRLDLSLGLQRLQHKRCPIVCLGRCRWPNLHQRPTVFLTLSTL